MVREKFFKQPADEEIVRRHLEEVLPPVFDQLEELFVETEAASQITIATISVWAPLVNLEHAGFELDAKNWPGVAAFQQTMNRHPVLRILVDEEHSAMDAPYDE